MFSLPTIRFAAATMTSVLAAQTPPNVYLEIDNPSVRGTLATSGAPGDIDDDGRQDLVLGNPANGEFKVFDGAGELQFTVRGSTNVGFGTKIACGQLNGQGGDDIVVIGRDRRVYTYLDGSPLPSAARQLSGVGGITDVKIGDVDGVPGNEIVVGIPGSDAIVTLDATLAQLGDYAGPQLSRLGEKIAIGTYAGQPVIYATAPRHRLVRAIDWDGNTLREFALPGTTGTAGTGGVATAGDSLLVGSPLDGDAEQGAFTVIDVATGEVTFHVTGTQPRESLGDDVVLFDEHTGWVLAKEPDRRGTLYHVEIDTSTRTPVLQGHAFMNMMLLAEPFEPFAGLDQKLPALLLPGASVNGRTGAAWVWKPDPVEVRAVDCCVQPGGTATIELYDPELANRPFAVFGSLTGWGPLDVFGLSIPLTWDVLTSIGPGAFANGSGQLDAEGRATVRFDLPNTPLGKTYTMFVAMIAIDAQGRIVTSELPAMIVLEP